MIEQLKKLVKGYVRIRVVSTSYDRFLNLCALHKFYLWDLQAMNGAYEMNISVEEFRQLRPLVKKCGAHITIQRKRGVPFFLYANRHRKSLGVGFIFGLTLMFFLSIFVWNIEINGNLSESTEVIFDYLKQEKIYYGSLKRGIDCKQLQEDLRRQFPDFTWVSAKIKGTSLLIDVKENDMGTVKGEEEYPVSDLAADSGGTIVSIVTRKGVPLVKAGDTVKKGDILVSGEIPILNDAKEITGYQYCGADADIEIKTVYTYKDSFPLAYQERVYTGQQKKGWLFRFRDQLFSLKPRNINYEEYDVFTKESQLGFSRYFKLPIYVGQIEAREYRTEKRKYEEKEAVLRMEDKIQKNLEKIQEKGVQIFENDVKIETDEKSCTASGRLTLIRKTGKRVERTTLDK